MDPIKYNLVEPTKGNINVSCKNNFYTFQFPCSNSHDCTEYELKINPGIYLIEVYGASGGFYSNYISTIRNSLSNGCITQTIKGNTECRGYSSMAGAGGYSSGVLNLKSITHAFLAIGGQGTFGYTLTEYSTPACYLPKNMLRGGFNGGGSASNFYSPGNFGSSGGGGASDLRINENDLFHRIIVAGGGGGTDNPYGGVGGSDDGSGGAGGGLIAQGYRINGRLDTTKVATQSSGFSFGNGEAAQQHKSKSPNGVQVVEGASDRSGAGGGWYGGFSSQHGDGGGGGGSSYVLTNESLIPTSNITIYSEFYDSLATGKYAFNHGSQFVMESARFASGIWAGNGFARITLIKRLSSSKPMTSNKMLKYCLFCHLIISTREK